MGRAPCCDKANVKKGPWSPEEDAKLKDYIEKNGTGGNWIALPQKIGLKRCGKSCRLRWLNYLRPNIKHGGFSEEEDNMICSLYIKIGSRWSIIAAHLPGRTDNDIKNYWNTKLKSKLLGKQRKQHRPRPRKNSRQQEANSGTQNLSLVNPEIAINLQNPYNYLVQLPETSAALVMPPTCLDQSFDCVDSTNEGAATMDIVMQELKGTRFDEDPSRKSSISTGIQYPNIDATLVQEYGTMATNPSLSTMMQALPFSSQIFTSSSTVVTSDCNQMISSTWPDMNYHQQVPNMFPGPEDVMFIENLHTLGEVDNYNCNHSNNGVMESWLYYGSSSGNSCSISTDGESNISWEDMNSSFVVNYPSMLADGSENCRGGVARGCTFEDQSRQLGPQ